MNVDYCTMDGGSIYHKEMTEEQYNAVPIGSLVTVYNKLYAVDRKVGYRFKAIYIRDVKVLECSSAGDKAFSAFYACVEVYGINDTIENHYQLSKRFGNFAPIAARAAKGKQPTHFVVNDFTYSLDMLSMWYKLLWMKYLDKNPMLVDYASQYDDFTDMYKGKNTRNCQADVIRQYIKEGRQSIVDDCLPLIWKMRENNKGGNEV